MRFKVIYLFIDINSRLLLLNLYSKLYIWEVKSSLSTLTSIVCYFLMVRLYSFRVRILSLSASMSLLLLWAGASCCCCYFSIVYTLKFYKQLQIVFVNLAFTLLTVKVAWAWLLFIKTLQLLFCLLVPLMKLFKLVVHQFLDLNFVLDKHATQIINTFGLLTRVEAKAHV